MSRADLSPRRVTPTARRLAALRGVDLRAVTGSGPDGRIVRADVEAAQPAGGEPSTTEPPLERIEITPLRRACAERLAYAASAIPSFHVTVWADMSAALAMHAAAREKGRPFDIADLVLAACARGIAAVPPLGDLWAGDHIVRRRGADIGLAVAPDTESPAERPASGPEMAIPVMRDVGRKRLDAIAQERMDLVDRARARERPLTADEQAGGLLTVSALEGPGVEQFLPMVRPGQAAGLGIGSIAERVVAEDGAMTVRPTLSLTLAADGRLVDGAAAARFLQVVKEALEAPESLDG